MLALGTPMSAACGGRQPAGPISEEQYVEIYVEILRAADEAADSIAASKRATEILAKHGVSQDDLLKFARLNSDADYLAEVWLEIENRLRNPEPDSTEAAPDSTATKSDSV